MREKINDKISDGVSRIIFLVDDEPDVREVMREYLEDHGFQIEQAAFGEEALKKLETLRPHLILLDVVMPNMDGLEVLARIRQNPKTAKIPVVMLTAKGNTRVIMKAQELQADDFMTKPFDSEEFLGMINKYIP